MRGLGKAIQSGGELTEREEARLDVFRQHADALQAHLEATVAQVLETRILEFRCAVVGRTKAWTTVIAKLEKGSSLDRIRDIIGIRVTVPGGRDAQDHVVGELEDVFGRAVNKVIDRRREPQEGYRAVHLEVKVGGAVCEIQIRTALQHRWAEIAERAADKLGRGLRYGEPAATEEGAEIWAMVKRFAHAISVLESREQFVAATPIFRFGFFAQLKTRYRLWSSRRELLSLSSKIEKVIDDASPGALG